MFYKKGVPKNFTKFTGKHLCQSLFFNKVAGLKPATLLKKRLWHKCFPVNFVNKKPFFTEHLWTTASEPLSFSIVSLHPTCCLSFSKALSEQKTFLNYLNLLTYPLKLNMNILFKVNEKPRKT